MEPPLPPDGRSSGVAAPMWLGTLGAVVVVLAGSLVRPGPGATWLWDGAVLHGAGPRAVAAVVSMIGVAMLIAAWWLVVVATHRRPVAPARLARVMACWSVPFLIGPPLFSQDVFSYAAQGEIVARGLDPSRVGPSALGPGPFLAHVAPLWRHTPAPYGPLWLRLGSLIATVSGHREPVAVLLLRLVAVLSVAGTGWALVALARRFDRDPGQVLALAVLNPVVVLHLVSGAHNEATMLLFLALGLLAATEGRTVLGLVLIAAATAVKAPAAVGLVFVGWRWVPDPAPLWKRVGAAAGAVGIGVAVLSVLGWATGLGWGWVHALGTPGKVRALEAPLGALAYAAWEISRLLGSPVARTSLVSAARLVGLLVAAVIATVAVLRSRGAVPLVSLAVALLAVNLFGPALYPWYLVTPLAFLAFAERPWKQRALIVLTVLFASVTEPSGSGLVFSLGALGPWVMPLLFVAAAWWCGRDAERRPWWSAGAGQSKTTVRPA